MRIEKMRITRLTVTESHIKLLRRTFFDYDEDTEFGAPIVDPKRPYGNSDVIGDIGEIIGEKPYYGSTIDDDAEFSEEQEEGFKRLHREMEAVLQILTSNLVIQPGEYRREDPYDSLSWRLVQ